MNFKEALIAHLQGEKVECRYKDGDFRTFAREFGEITIENSVAESTGACHEFRLAPRTITVNGVEVPAPEKVAPADDEEYYIPKPCRADFCVQQTWASDYLDKHALERGLVYLNKEDAIARAKAMLITS